MIAPVKTESFNSINLYKTKNAGQGLTQRFSIKPSKQYFKIQFSSNVVFVDLSSSKRFSLVVMWFYRFVVVSFVVYLY